MSSHREAPEISKDPVADSTDLYAFVSPDDPTTVTLIANYIPLQPPAAGPNFFEFGDDVLYEINIDNDGDGKADIVYSFQFTTTVLNPNTFLYNTGQILSLTDPHFNRRQTYTVKRKQGEHTVTLAEGLACPPCNVGPRSIPDYSALAQAAVWPLPGDRTVFAGQRADGFFVDLGAVFDLADLRPFQNLQLIPTPAKPGVNALANVNVHSIALKVPIADLVDDSPVIGVWTSASRPKVHIQDPGTAHESGPWVQVSRLGNPLFNEVLVPMARKDLWNSQYPDRDSQFADGVLHPELAGLLNVLYPGIFPNLAAFVASGKPRVDLAAILLTGIPAGVVSPSYTTFTGTTQADMLRLNTSIGPNPAPDVLGLLGNDLSGYPNGRRVIDDVFTIELRCIAGVSLPLVEAYTPDPAAAAVSDNLTFTNYLPNFPYLGVPYSGFDVPSS